MENKLKTLVMFHEHNGMTDLPELQLRDESGNYLVIIDADDFKALEGAGLHPYMYEDLITYAFHLNPVEMKGYSRADFSIEWSENNTVELKQEWDAAIEAYDNEREASKAKSLGYTAGPWKSQQWGQDFICKGAKGQRVFSIRDGVLPNGIDRHMIDSAPAMLRALRAAKVVMDDLATEEDGYDRQENRVLVVALSQVNEAIALAEGRDIA